MRTTRSPWVGRDGGRSADTGEGREGGTVSRAASIRSPSDEGFHPSLPSTKAHFAFCVQLNNKASPKNMRGEFAWLYGMDGSQKCGCGAELVLMDRSAGFGLVSLPARPSERFTDKPIWEGGGRRREGRARAGEGMNLQGHSSPLPLRCFDLHG